MLIHRPNFFLARLDFFPPPITAPGSLRMVLKRKGKETPTFAKSNDGENRKYYNMEKFSIFSAFPCGTEVVSGAAGPVSRKPRKLFGPVAIFSSSVSENGEVYAPETSCVKRTSVYIKNT